jgi:hypothetical protein
MFSARTATSMGPEGKTCIPVGLQNIINVKRNMLEAEGII